MMGESLKSRYVKNLSVLTVMINVDLFLPHNNLFDNVIVIDGIESAWRRIRVGNICDRLWLLFTLSFSNKTWFRWLPALSCRGSLPRYYIDTFMKWILYRGRIFYCYLSQSPATAVRIFIIIFSTSAISHIRKLFYNFWVPFISHYEQDWFK